LKSGKLRAYRLGRTVLVPEEALEEALKPVEVAK